MDKHDKHNKPGKHKKNAAKGKAARPTETPATSGAEATPKPLTGKDPR
jgi:hypothetical protein